MTSTIARPGTDLVVHIGLPKTGTTFLQNQVFRTFSQVADFGKTASYHVERPHVYEALKMIRTLPDVEFKMRSSSIKTVLRREAEQATIQHPATACRLLSYEGFFHPHSIHPIDIYTRLGSIFGRFKILITIRQQFEWIESLYLYKFYRFLKGGSGSFEAWAERSRTRGEWNTMVCCDYWSVIEQLIDRAGHEYVLVEPMEGLVKACDETAMARLASFLAVDADTLGRQFRQAEPTKQRIDELGFLLGRTLYESRTNNLSADELLRVKRVFRTVHAQFKEHYKKATVPHDIIERCLSKAELTAIKDGNVALSKWLGQDLARFGYPVHAVTNRSAV